MRAIVIPVAGTLAALVVVVLARGERTGTTYPLNPLPSVLRESTREPFPEVEPPPAVPDEYSVELRADGVFLVEGKTYDSLAELLKAIAPIGAPVPPIVTFTAAKGASEGLVAQAREKLAERCTLEEPPAHKAPATPAETFHINLRETGAYEVVETNDSYDTLEALLKAIAPPDKTRPEIRLFTTSRDVGQDQLDTLAGKLRDAGCDVVIKTSGAEENK